MESTEKNRILIKFREHLEKNELNDAFEMIDDLVKEKLGAKMADAIDAYLKKCDESSAKRIRDRFKNIECIRIDLNDNYRLATYVKHKIPRKKKITAVALVLIIAFTAVGVYTLTEEHPMDGLTINSDSDVICIDQTVTFTVDVSPANTTDKTVSWSVEGENATGTVSKDGKSYSVTLSGTVETGDIITVFAHSDKYGMTASKNITVQSSKTVFLNSESNNSIYTIPSDIDTIEFCGDSISLENFSISIGSRTDSLRIILKDVSLTATDGHAGIYCVDQNASFRVNLNTIGSVSVTGSDGISGSAGYPAISVGNVGISASSTLNLTGGNGCDGTSSANGSQGGDAIVSNTLSMSGTGVIKVMGGNGGKGGSGIDGYDGRTGDNATETVNASDGSDGSNGSGGGDGGTGGYAIRTTKIEILTGVTLDLYSGNGGDGGKGGDGGDGGDGGMGLNTLGEVRSGSNGGNGGNSGTGGNGGDSPKTISVSSVSGYFTEHRSMGGHGGDSGKPGKGGDGGDGQINSWFVVKIPTVSNGGDGGDGGDVAQAGLGGYGDVNGSNGRREDPGLGGARGEPGLVTADVSGTKYFGYHGEPGNKGVYL